MLVGDQTLSFQYKSLNVITVILRQVKTFFICPVADIIYRFSHETNRLTKACLFHVRSAQISGFGGDTDPVPSDTSQITQLM